MYIIIKDVNGDLNFLYDLELLILSSGTGTVSYGENWQHEKYIKK